MVIGPSPVDSVELLYELFLGGVPVSFDHSPHVSSVAFDCLVAGMDDRFKTKRVTSWIRPSVSFAHRKLADSPAQKIEPQVPLIVMERMGDAGFTGL